jgi:hypothetical protein
MTKIQVSLSLHTKTIAYQKEHEEYIGIIPKITISN